jgi:hypothetical protein
MLKKGRSECSRWENCRSCLKACANGRNLRLTLSVRSGRLGVASKWQDRVALVEIVVLALFVHRDIASAGGTTYGWTD